MDVRGRSPFRGLTPSGLVIAAVGFLLTRFTVTLAADWEPIRFLLVGLGPLAVGLSVAIAGVALAVGAFHPQYVRTVAVWTIVGTASMGLLVLLTLYGRLPAELSVATLRSEPAFSNFLIGGCVGGTLTGVYAARNERRQRAERAQAKRLAVLNHVFRDAALNAITAIRGRIDVIRNGDGETRDSALDVIAERTTELEDDVEELRRLTRGARAGATRLEPVDLVTRLENCVDALDERFPAAEVVLTGAPTTARVWATDTLEDALGMVIESAIERHPDGAPRVEVRVEEAGGAYRVAVVDDGPPLSAAQRRLFAGAADDDDVDPTGGFGLHVAELLVESYRGELSARAADDTTVEIELASAEGSATPTTASVAGTPSRGVTRHRLVLVGAAAVLAGVVMGVVSEALGGSVPVIGTLYDLADPLVGWTTHLFHSVVFGLIYAGALGAAPTRFDTGHLRRVGVAIAWGVLLWLVAAGVVMPVWLQLVGVPAGVPTLTARLFVTHVVWGAVLGATYSVGRHWLAARAAGDVTVDGPTPSP